MSTIDELHDRMEKVRMQLAVIASCAVCRLQDGRFVAEMPGGWFIALPDLTEADIAKAKGETSAF